MENDTGAEKRQGELVVRCECGFEACATEAELVPVVQRHGRESHNMHVTREQVLAMARPA
jgi:predicted small metal-binding protein